MDAITFPHVFHASQALLSAYSLYISSVTIPKLRKNEDIANKAAKWSNYVDKQLWQVKVTQASGAVAVRPCSLLPSTTFDQRPYDLTIHIAPHLPRHSRRPDIHLSRTADDVDARTGELRPDGRGARPRQ